MTRPYPLRLRVSTHVFDCRRQVFTFVISLKVFLLLFSVISRIDGTICNVVICLDIEKNLKSKECVLSGLSTLEKQAFAQEANPIWRRSTRNLLEIENP